MRPPSVFGRTLSRWTDSCASGIVGSQRAVVPSFGSGTLAAGEELLEPVQRETARRKLESGARPERHRDDDDQRRQQPDIDEDHDRQQQPGRMAAHEVISRRPVRRVANKAQNISIRVSSTRVSARLDALGQLNETKTSS